jgi:hypothetical protein
MPAMVGAILATDRRGKRKWRGGEGMEAVMPASTGRGRRGRTWPALRLGAGSAMDGNVEEIGEDG